MDSLAKAIAAFIAGFVAGASELAVGLSFFFGDVVKEALNPFVTSPESA
jgi:hypothetical protein